MWGEPEPDIMLVTLLLPNSRSPAEYRCATYSHGGHGLLSTYRCLLAISERFPVAQLSPVGHCHHYLYNRSSAQVVKHMQDNICNKYTLTPGALGKEELEVVGKLFSSLSWGWVWTTRISWEGLNGYLLTKQQKFDVFLTSFHFVHSFRVFLRG